MTIDHSKIMDRYKEAEDGWSEIYARIEDDIEFLLNTDNCQWEDGRAYEPDKLKIVINKCESEVDAIINEMRASRPAIRTAPIDNNADVDTSQVLNGLIRNIEQISDAASAYDTSAYPQVAGGWGLSACPLIGLRARLIRSQRLRLCLILLRFSSILFLRR